MAVRMVKLVSMSVLNRSGLVFVSVVVVFVNNVNNYNSSQLTSKSRDTNICSESILNAVI